MESAVVLYHGAAGVGHVTPMAELAKVFLGRGYQVQMVLIDPSDSAVVRRRISEEAYPSFFSVHVLTPVPSPPKPATSSGAGTMLAVFRLLRRYNGELEAFLRFFPARCLVVDMFCVDAIDVAARLNVPAYTFFPSSASALAVLVQVPALLAGRRTGLKELGGAPLQFLGVPPVPASHLIRSLLEPPDYERCRAMADVWARCTGTRGVLVNTFEALESPAVRALADHRCVAGRRPLPPVYCVGPLVGSDGATAAEEETRHKCLAWLDAQPERSVVLLCFGSRGAPHSPEQLREIAAGLDKFGHRFLWVIRTPEACSGGDDHDLAALLPVGFLQRTKTRGLVVASWAPQARLRHPSTAAFVTHCGWNSALEAIVAGVPMLCWPMQAEQRMNKVFLTAAAAGMGVGAAVEGAGARLVGADEVEAKVPLVMEAEEGDRIRARVEARREEARAALADGGSSTAAFARFLSNMDNAS